MERLLDVAQWLIANNRNASSIPQLRELLGEIQNRLLEDFNHQVYSFSTPQFVTYLFTYVITSGFVVFCYCRVSAPLCNNDVKDVKVHYAIA